MKILVSAMVFGLALSAGTTLLRSVPASAAENTSIAGENAVVGIDRIKRDIRNGAYPYSGQGPWRVTYTGPLSLSGVVVKVLPEGAFMTERDGNSRDFRVTLVNPQALIADDYGNLAEIGVYVGDNIDGTGLSVCEIRTSFLSTGTRMPLPLESIYRSNPGNLQLTINPSDTVELIKYDGNSAVFKRIVGDNRPVFVTARLRSGAGWTSYTSDPLPICSSTPAPNQGSEPTPQNPAPQRSAQRYRQVEVSRRYVSFTLFSKDVDNRDSATSYGRRTQSAACTEAKDSLREYVLTDAACSEKAKYKTYAPKQPERNFNDMIRSGDLDPTVQHEYLEPENAERIPGSGSSSCSCEKVLYNGDRDCTYDCTAKGSVECRVPIVTYEFVPVQ